MEISNNFISMHPFSLMHKLKECIVSFDTQKEVINASVKVDVGGESKDVAVIIERRDDENLTNVWSARAMLFSDQESAEFEWQAMRKVSDLLSSK